jgi:Alpha/beta hydrolase
MTTSFARPTTLWSSLHSELSANGGAPWEEARLPPTPIQQRRRRGFSSEADNGLAAVQLVEDDGILRWVYEPPLLRRAGTRRAWRASVTSWRDVVERYEFPELGENQVTAALVGVDMMLNSERGLRRWERAPGGAFGEGTWRAISPHEVRAVKGRVLLLIHGTFSKSGMYDSELLAVPEKNPPLPGTPGQQLWERWTDPKNGYAAVLAFEHATLSVAPWLNAIALVRALDGLQAPLDVLCHSRGGLVARWALSFGHLKVSQIVFVGSPLMGTSLAAPNRLRAALDLLANVASAVSITSVGVAAAIPPAAPLALGAAGLSRVLGRTLRLGSSIPLADAAVGLVPGLQSQSRVANNLELRELSQTTTNVKLRGIGVVFKPIEVETSPWKFWKRFSNLGAQAGYYVADMIFQQPNDLVVDIDSMNQLGPKDKNDIAPRLDTAEWKNLGEKPDTHHCSYFRDAAVIDQLDKWLR